MFRLEGTLVAGAVGFYVRTQNGALWSIGKLRDISHLLHENVIVEGIRTGVDAIATNWIEAVMPAGGSAGLKGAILRPIG